MKKILLDNSDLITKTINRYKNTNSDVAITIYDGNGVEIDVMLYLGNDESESINEMSFGYVPEGEVDFNDPKIDYREINIRDFDISDVINMIKV